LEIETVAHGKMEASGLIPKGSTAKLFDALGSGFVFNEDELNAIESETKHDFIAFLIYLERKLGKYSKWIHRGMTSSDVVDTAYSMALHKAGRSIVERIDKIIEVLDEKSREYAETPMIGRSHGMHAEPVTFGVVLAGHNSEFRRTRDRLRYAVADIKYGKLSGAVGMYTHLSPALENAVLVELGMYPEPVSTQVIPRDRHLFFFMTLQLVASAIERFATNMRHWQRTEVGEVRERFESGQKGSSAMPHKRNPILSENLCGLSRLVKGYVVSAMDNTALWHERDISHSSVERVIGPDITCVVASMLDKFLNVISNMDIDTDNMRRNLMSHGRSIFSESLMLAMIDKGLNRQEAYVIVQKAIMKSFAEGMNGLGMESHLMADKECPLSKEEIEKVADWDHSIRHSKQIIDRSINLK
jgi:adenylosuccinate lyase